jgi:hypothetical protein
MRNLQANPRVTVELGDETRAGVAQVLAQGSAVDQLAGELLLATYADNEDNSDEWGRTSLPIMTEFPGDPPVVR